MKVEIHKRIVNVLVFNVNQLGFQATITLMELWLAQEWSSLLLWVSCKRIHFWAVGSYSHSKTQLLKK